MGSISMMVESVKRRFASRIIRLASESIGLVTVDCLPVMVGLEVFIGCCCCCCDDCGCGCDDCGCGCDDCGCCCGCDETTIDLFVPVMSASEESILCCGGEGVCDSCSLASDFLV